MITQGQLERLYGDEADQLFTYLKNKHRGGTSNSKGNSFENQFAVFKIAEQFNKQFANQTPTNDVQFYSQELCFVDDFIVKTGTENSAEHYQLKDVQSLRWDGNSHPLSDDFRKQHAICAEAGETSHLELVVSSRDVKHELEENMPEDLNEIVTVHHFPKGDSINQLLHHNAEIKASLTNMCALDSPTSDKLDTLGTIVLGAWAGSSQKGTTLEELLDVCYKQNPHYIKGFDTRVSKELKEALDRIAGFSHKIEGGYIRWTYEETDDGVVSYQIGSVGFLNWESQVIGLNANNFDELESFLT